MKLIKCKIKDLGTVLTGNTPPTSQRQYYGDLYPLIKPTDMKIDYRYIGETEERLSEEGYRLFKGKLLPKDTTCVVTIGTIGKLCLTKEPSFCNQAVNSIIVNKKSYNSLYVFYLMKNSISKVKFLSSGTASGRENVSKTAFENIQIQVIELQAQCKIASILSAYDDLIENNTRRIKILEEMAQTLYNEWFVKFRFPGHEQVKMVESGLGLIPEGWEVTNLGSLISYHIGGGWGQDKIDEKHIVPAFVIRGTDIPPARHLDLHDCPLRFHTQSNFKSRKLEAGDIVFEVSGGSKGQPVGRALLISKKLLNVLNENVICASFCKLLRPNKSLVSPEIIYLLILAMYDDGRIEKHQVQSTGITNFKFTPFLEGELVLIPTLDIQEKFCKLAVPLFDLVVNLGAKNANLRQTRDLLLPKLISGEIDVEKLNIDTLDIAA